MLQSGSTYSANAVVSFSIMSNAAKNFKPLIPFLSSGTFPNISSPITTRPFRSLFNKAFLISSPEVLKPIFHAPWLFALAFNTIMPLCGRVKFPVNTVISANTFNAAFGNVFSSAIMIGFLAFLNASATDTAAGITSTFSNALISSSPFTKPLIASFLIVPLSTNTLRTRVKNTS